MCLGMCTLSLIHQSFWILLILHIVLYILLSLSLSPPLSIAPYGFKLGLYGTNLSGI